MGRGQPLPATMPKFDISRGTKKYYPDVNTINPDIWGKKCFVIAGGSSGRRFDLKLLDNYFTIGINFVYFKYDPNIIFMIDSAAYKRAIQNKKFKISTALKIWCLYYNYEMDDIYYLRPCGRYGISRSLEDGLYHGNNSGYCGIQLAIALGFTEINLIGVDCNTENGKWHLTDNWQHRPDMLRTMNDFREGYEKLATEIKKTDIKIYNLNEKSAVKGFPFKTFTEALNVQ